MRRLLNALYRGGVTSETTSDQWSVWRGRDQRYRQIGTLPGANIDLLRLHSILMPAGSSGRCVLMWRDQACGVEAALGIMTSSSSERPYIDQLIQYGELGETRSRLMLTARAFCQDSNVSPDMSEMGTSAEAACERLGYVTARLTIEDCRFLHQFLNGAATKSNLATQFSLRPDAVRTRAVSILRALTDVYRAATFA
ncbi:MAG: hypothetical protein AAFN91_16030 [Pseudomonadota bacterium]